jgi:hypothetical protein
MGPPPPPRGKGLIRHCVPQRQHSPLSSGGAEKISRSLHAAETTWNTRFAADLATIVAHRATITETRGRSENPARSVTETETEFNQM